MDALSIAASSGLRSRLDALEMLANNLANTSTDGFKLDREGYGLYLAPEAATNDGNMPTEVPVIERHWTDYSQGTLRPTGSPWDLALSGRGFFTVSGPNGPLYTRNGSFRLSKSGDVTTAEGYALRTRNGTALRLVSSEPPEVAPDGGVRQNGQLVGQLELVEFRNPSALAKQGANYFRNADLRQGPVPAASAEVHQGQLENSNVSAPEGAVRLIGVMRQFEMLQKAITLGAEMNRKAIDEVARV